ncbi:hypothetical protein [Brachyspira pilosicoli]|uniref:hypothetical protein n=1 Tax=Brachyspira pilosicoli TaxID=52584 RepID=UPI003003DBCA
MFKRIFVLIVVLFAVISCKQSPSTILSSPPTVDDGTTDNNIDSGNSNGGNTDGGNTDNNTDSGSGYGVYKVFILGDNEKTITNEYRISDTYEIFDAYTNMILNDKKESKFNLYKNNTASTLAESSGSEDIETTVSDIYTFDKNLNIIKAETTDGGSKNTASAVIYKKFRGVCIVRIYPKNTKTSDFSLIGEYTLAGVYTEMIASAAGNGLQNYGYDELIVLRYDEKVPDAALSTASAVKYKANILFNINKSIDLYYYNPNRTFKKQNTDYIFERIAETTTVE